MAVPLISDAYERSFSSRRDLVYYKRSRLLSDVIEVCIRLRNWYGKPTLRKVKVRKVDKEGNTVTEEQPLEMFNNDEQVQNAYSSR